MRSLTVRVLVETMGHRSFGALALRSSGPERELWTAWGPKHLMAKEPGRLIERSTPVWPKRQALETQRENHSQRHWLRSVLTAGAA